MLSAMPEPRDGPPCWSAFFRKPANLAMLLRTVDTFVAKRPAPLSSPVGTEDRPVSPWQPSNPRCWP
jgi:hypothetical protein